MNKYFSRVTSSARGEVFNPLVWPFLFSTLAYGVGFTAFINTGAVGQSSLFIAMAGFHAVIPVIWGSIALITIFTGLTFLLFNIPPIGKVSGLIGFMLWLFASFCWGLSGGWLLMVSIGIPNLWFWFWQYLSLSHFRREDAEDKETMKFYDTGQYDNKKHPKDAKTDREDNRGKDRQSNQTYDIKDDGTDTTRSTEENK